jgi:hypothetical protein
VINTLGTREVSEQMGLHRGDHSGLRDIIFNPDPWGVGTVAESVWISSYDQLYELAATRAPLQLSGAAWYHHVAVRGVQGDRIWIANSAPGYRGVFETIDRTQYATLGSWRVTCVR